MPTNAVGGVVCFHHHDSGVPANKRSNATFDVFVTGEPWLLLPGNGVDVRGAYRCWEADLTSVGVSEQLRQDESCSCLSF